MAMTGMKRKPGAGNSEEHGGNREAERSEWLGSNKEPK